MRVQLSAALLAGVFVSAPVPASADGIWSTPLDISPAASSASVPQITSSADGKNLTSVWSSNASGQNRALAAFSTNHGSTWSASQVINAPTGQASDIRLAGSQDGRRAVATFVDFQAPDKEIVRSATLTNGVWAAPVDVSVLAQSSGKPSPSVAMSADGTRVVAVFSQLQGAVHQIQARVSVNSGATYAGAVPIAAGVTEPESMSVRSSADGQRLVAVWRQEVGGSPEIHASFSTNGGGTWSAAERLSASGRAAGDPDVMISTNGSTAVAAWRERVTPTQRQVHTRTLSGGSWLPSERLSPVGQDATTPQVTGGSDLSSATVVWANASAQQVQAARGIGQSWSGPFDVSDAGTLVQVPDVASGADGSRMAAVWRQSSNQIISAESQDGGVTWTRRISLSNAVPGTDDPQIASAISGFRFGAVWSRPAGGDIRIQAANYFEAQPQTITFNQPGNVTVGTSVPLSATSTSGLPISFASSTPGTCTVAGTQLTAVAVGTCSVTASQAGNLDVLPAGDVTRTLTVSGPQITPDGDPPVVNPGINPPVQRVQNLTCAKTPPRTIKRRGTTVVLPRNCRTDAGQRVTVTVEGKRKDLRRIQVVKKAGKTSVRTSGARVTLTLTYRATGTAEVQEFSLVRRYRT